MAKRTTKKTKQKATTAKAAGGSPLETRDGKPTPTPITASGSGYTVLARRYRSRDFDELIGQEPIARTLQNAIRTNRTAHAYLFCGTRGVGKTSMARIFAKALNATDDLAQRDAIAEAILRGDDLDVIEIDGASNRGIADARDLIAGAGLSPARCRYKIYIIDEVHALTKDAFNALLKTMEEPPSHVKFILCTTEAHKVPQTIQSRCQRFDFRPIPTSKIAEQLRAILKSEKIEADDEVIVHVAQLGNGSMRDALSLLDRLLSAGEGKLTAELLEQMVGLPDQQLIIELTNAIIAGDARRTLEQGAELINRGSPVEQILELLAEHFRHLMIVAACGEDSDLLEMSPEAKKTAAEQAKHFDAAGLVHLIAICDAVSHNAKASSTARALFDAAIVRMAMSDHLADIPTLMRGGPPPAAAPRPHLDAGKKKATDDMSAAPTTGTTARPSRHSASVAEVKPAVNPQAAESGPQGGTRPTDAKPEAAGAISGEDIWRSLLDAASRSEAVKANVEPFRYHSFDGTTLTLAPTNLDGQSMRMLQMQAERLISVVRNETGRTVSIAVLEPEGGAPPNHAPPAMDSNQADAVRDLPLIRHAIDTFDATIVNVRDAK
jgi:DNA polymerase III subunit gamma/tau